MILFALTLVVLLVFTAFAIDLGNQRQKKRQTQGGADAGALGAIQDLQSQGTAQAIAEVKSLVEQNLELPSGSITSADWSSCSTPTGTTPRYTAPWTCISYNNNLSELRVRVPDRVFKTYFGGVVGVNTLTVRGEATARIVAGGFGGVLPFGLAAGAGGGDGYECIKSPGGGTSTDVCDGPDSGNFGFLNFRFYDSTNLSCTGDGKNRVDSNMAVGIDHPLSRLDGPPYNGTSMGDQCQGSTVDNPNGTDTLTGNITTDFDCGILHAPSGSGCFALTDGGVGRLARGSNTTTVGGQAIDNKPLWEFIPNTALADIPAACQRSQFDGADGASGTGNSLPTSPVDVKTYIMSKTDKKERMRLMLQRCFSIYNDGRWTVSDGATSFNEVAPSATGSYTGVVFGQNSATETPFDLYDIQLTPRFAYVPQLSVTAAGLGGNTFVNFIVFRPIFLQRLLSNCTGSGCNVDWEPKGGITGSWGNSPTLGGNTNAITAFVFNGKMLPGDLGADDAPFDVGTNKFVQLVD